jgi:rSAM/selenodomain-associated transferase 1
VVFARHPEPGSAPAQLVTALGEQSALGLQRDMAAHVVRRVASLVARARLARAVGELRGQPESVLTVQIRYAGATDQPMRSWLGRRWSYRAQGEGGLGERLARAFAGSFAYGADRTLVVGTDCPALGPADLEQAFASLAHCDAVLGPTRQGGCYLVGLRREAWRRAERPLFDAPVWDGNDVVPSLRRRAHDAGATVALARTLAAIHRPEDLAVWERARAASGESPDGVHPARISVIVPTTNGERCLETALASACAGTDVEVVLVRGRTADEAAPAAAPRGVRVIPSLLGRAAQLNSGAAAATGGVLLFLHPDTVLPSGFDADVRLALRDPRVVGGSFSFVTDLDGVGARVAERLINLRARWLRAPHGRQGLFVRAGAFRALGGFAEEAPLEDLDLVLRLRRRGKLVCLSAPAVTAAPRLQQRGPLRASAVHHAVLAGYVVGVDRDRLLRWNGHAGL